HASTPRPHFHKLSNQPRMITGRVRPNDHGEVGVIEIVERDGCGTRTNGHRESYTACLVAVVGAVVHVVRAVDAREPLEKKGGLVAAASRGIEEAAAWIGVA